MIQHSPKFLRHRKFMTVVPLIILPFLTIIFWLLGGGKTAGLQNIDVKGLLGLNINLPSAYFKEEKFDKLSLYQKVKSDSIRLLQERRNDPYFELNPIPQPSIAIDPNPDSILNQPGNKINRKKTSSRLKNLDQNEELVNKKLEELNKVINKAPEELQGSVETNTSNIIDNQFTSDVEKLEQMMHLMSSGETDQDPELMQLQGLMEQILDIQHPDRARQKIRAQSLQDKKKAFPVLAIAEKDAISLIEPVPYQANSKTDNPDYDSVNYKDDNFLLTPTRNGFFGLIEETDQDPRSSNAIEAVVHETQEVVNGSTIKLRLLNDVYVKGQLIPEGNFIYGNCQINKERLNISIPSIKYETSLFPVALSAYDLDGLEGIYIPGAISRDVAKQASDQAVQGFNLQSFDPSLAAQATTAGINAAKGLLSRKAKLIKITVKAGYQVILTDINT